MSNYKILVADDSDTILKTIGHVVRKNALNYDLTFATDGKMACKLALSNQPDLILMDLQMPVMDGIRAIHVLKRNQQTHRIPIVVMTSNRELHEAFEAGADDFIYKPFDEYELLFRLRFALTLRDTVWKVQEQNQILMQQSHEVKLHLYRIEEQRKDIIDDITYSRRIQNAIFPDRLLMHQLFPEHFIYNKPKRIVSGDFYWIASKDNKQILAVADCTGHGISGAFLTIAGTAFLNEIINYTNPEPAEILNQLRLRIMRLMNQKGIEGEATDGMDISLCVFDFENLTLQYAGANNPSLLVRTDKKIEICPADRMPIGIHDKSQLPFTNHTYKVSKGDMVYMFSDGYADQFGGPHDQKFRPKRLQNLCAELRDKSMKEQYDGFDRAMDEWIDYRDQVDDILLIGIRI